MQPTHANRDGRSLANWVRAAGRALCAYARKVSERRKYPDLLWLDDHILKDIGITRDMVHHEMRKPFLWMG